MSCSDDGEPLRAFENLITQLNSAGSVGKSPLVGLEGTDMEGGGNREDEPELMPAVELGGRGEVWGHQAP